LSRARAASSPDGDCLHVGRRDRNGAGRCPGMTANEVDEVAEEGVASRGVGSLEGLDGRAVVRAEVVDVRLCRAEAERERALPAGERVDLVAEQLAQIRLGAPKDR